MAKCCMFSGIKLIGKKAQLGFEARKKGSCVSAAVYVQQLEGPRHGNGALLASAPTTSIALAYHIGPAVLPGLDILVQPEKPAPLHKVA